MKLFRDFIVFLREIFSRRELLIQLAKRDFTSRYLGSALGFIWGYIQPAIMIAILLFIFEVGFRTQPLNDVPFALWFVTGILPWFFIAEAISSSTNAVLEYNYLVKKIAFRVSLLPIIKIISALVIHFFFILVLFGIFFAYQYELSIHSLQVFYFLFSAIVYLLGLAWITSSLIVFLKDVGEFVAMILSFQFWLTPIMWDIGVVAEEYRVFFRLNPFFYITEGYRQSFLYQQWFWEGDFLIATVSFWTIAIVQFVAGAVLFRQLKPHFADVI